MLVAYTKPLFAWDCLEDSPGLQTIKAFLTTLPDGPLRDGLRRARGRAVFDVLIQRLGLAVVDLGKDTGG